MWPFNLRRCTCTHERRDHGPEWGWTSCTRCGCRVFQWRLFRR